MLEYNIIYLLDRLYRNEQSFDQVMIDLPLLLDVHFQLVNLTQRILVPDEILFVPALANPQHVRDNDPDAEE